MLFFFPTFSSQRVSCSRLLFHVRRVGKELLLVRRPVEDPVVGCHLARGKVDISHVRCRYQYDVNVALVDLGMVPLKLFDSYKVRDLYQARVVGEQCEGYQHAFFFLLHIETHVESQTLEICIRIPTTSNQQSRLCQQIVGGADEMLTLVMKKGKMQATGYSCEWLAVTRELNETHDYVQASGFRLQASGMRLFYIRVNVKALVTGSSITKVVAKLHFGTLQLRLRLRYGCRRAFFYIQGSHKIYVQSVFVIPVLAPVSQYLLQVF
jgi:hypothetical protein